MTVQLEICAWGTALVMVVTLLFGAPLPGAVAGGKVSQSPQADWPQLQYDAGHTGFNPARAARGPYRLKWFRDLKEPIQASHQPIVVGDKLFVGTARGNLYALDRQSGQTRWVFLTRGPILGSPAWAKDIVYVNSMDHYCHALHAETGQEIWKFRTGEGIWAAPVIADGKVFVAGRDGFVYALDPETGSPVWKAPIPNLVMSTPAYCEGVLFVPAGDMRVYALDGAAGRRLWSSDPLPGAAIREFWLTASHGCVLATTQRVGGKPYVRSIQQEVFTPFLDKHKDDSVLVEDEIFKRLKDYYKVHPRDRTIFVLDAATGKDKFIVPLCAVWGGGATSAPAAVTPDGWAYTVYATLRLGASSPALLGRYSLQNGKMESLLPDRYKPWPFDWPKMYPKEGAWPYQGSPEASIFKGGFNVSDQNWVVAISGDKVLITKNANEAIYTMYDLATGRDTHAVPHLEKRTYPKGGMIGHHHATCSPAFICGNEMFHKTAYSELFAFEARFPK